MILETKSGFKGLNLGPRDFHTTAENVCSREPGWRVENSNRSNVYYRLPGRRHGNFGSAGDGTTFLSASAKALSMDERLPGINRFSRHKLLSIMAFGLVLSSCGPSPIDPAELFHSDKPLRKGQEIAGLGTVEGLSNNRGHADLTLVRIANCADAESLGDFDVVLDDRGKEMAGETAGQLIKFRGSLTGNSTVGLKLIPSANIQSDNGSVVSARVPELMLRDFHQVGGLSEIGCGKQ